MPDNSLQQALLARQPQLNLLRGAQTIQAAPPGDVDPSEIMRGEVPIPNASVGDMVGSGSIMDRMYAEANPIYKGMQESGMFDRLKEAAQLPEEAVAKAKNMFDPEHAAWIREQQARVPTLEALGRQLRPAGGAPYANVTRQPVQGGVLYDVLQRAAEKAATGVGNTPGEARLLEHFSKLIR